MKIDLRRERPDLYRPGSADFVEVDVPPTTYLAIDGHGDPNTTPTYAEALAALYTASYAVRAALRRRTGAELVVGPLGGLWSSSDPMAFSARRKDEWDWKMLIPLPDVVGADDLAEGLSTAASKHPDRGTDRVRRLELDEGRSLQILHVGTFDAEAATLARLHDEVMPARGLTWNGPHHEIYLSDARRVTPERMRTVLRQPVRPVV